MITVTEWNPRYVLYAKEHGKEPAEMVAYDAERYPGGKMAGFMVWISERWTEFDAFFGCKPGCEDSRTDQRMKEFDDWLAQGHPAEWDRWGTARG